MGMEDKRKGLGSMILSMSSTAASNASKTWGSTASLITSTVIGEGKRRFAMLQLFRLTLAPAKTLVMLQPSIKQCPFMDDADAYTLGQVYAGLPLHNAYATGHAHNPGYII